jgi:hypothetical protein
MDNIKNSFPVEFIHKDEFFEKGRIVYEKIGIENYIKEIKIMNNLQHEGCMKIDLRNNKLQIIISISSSKLGIGSGGGVKTFSDHQCEDFADVLAHELFHSEIRVRIVKELGLGGFGLIHNSEKKWSQIAWRAFDEYYACRKNAEEFGSFKVAESVKSVKKIEEKLCELKKISQKKNEMNYVPEEHINDLLYSLATISAFADVSKEKEEVLLKEMDKLKNIFQEVKGTFNGVYQEMNLNVEKFDEIGCKLQQIYNVHILDKYI